MTRRRGPIWVGGGAVIALLIAGLLGPARPALEAWWTGAFGSWYAFTSGTLVRATPLILAGLAVAVAFRAGVFNIGVEGQLLAGAAVATMIGVSIGSSLGGASPIVELLAGAVAGAAWAGIAAVLRTRFHVLEVISTIMLNFLAAYGIGYLVRGPMQEHLHIYPQSETLPDSARLPLLGGGTRLHAGFAIAVLLAVAAWYALRFTAAGFRLRAVGANPAAAQSAGRIDVIRTTTRAFLVSGALAGIAGACEVMGVTFALYENLSPGYGFTAIAVALLARLHPLAVIATGVLFGALESGAAAMQRDAGVPSVLATVVEAIVILAVVAVGRLRLPVAAAVPRSNTVSEPRVAR